MPLRLALTVLSLCVASAWPAAGQSGPTLADMALEWSRGHFATPVICEFEGKPVRGRRRIRIGPGPGHVRPPVAKIVFVDLEVDDASRCFVELSGDTPNITGALQFRLPGVWRSEHAQRELRDQLRRKKGFEYEIVAGGLRIGRVQQPPVPPRGVDFRGGKLALREVGRGTDSERLLADFDSPRKLVLEISARDGTKLSFPLYLTTLR